MRERWSIDKKLRGEMFLIAELDGIDMFLREVHAGTYTFSVKFLEGVANRRESIFCGLERKHLWEDFIKTRRLCALPC